MKLEPQEIKEIAEAILEQLRPTLIKDIAALIMNNGKEDLLTVREAMGILKFKSKKAIYDRIKDKRLSAVKEGTVIRISKQSVEKLMKAI